MIIGESRLKKILLGEIIEIKHNSKSPNKVRDYITNVYNLRVCVKSVTSNLEPDAVVGREVNK